LNFAALILAHLLGDYILQNDWMAQNKTSSTLPCLAHCALYTAAVWGVTLIEGAAWPAWALVVCFALHFVIDRWRLAAKAMKYTGQRGFRENLAPWSVIIVDNTWHLLTLYLLNLGVS
jgi:hypothetical protein